VVKIERIAQERCEEAEKASHEKKDRKKACAKKWDPYNALPLTRNNGLQPAGSAGFSDECRQRKAKLNA